MSNRKRISVSEEAYDLMEVIILNLPVSKETADEKNENDGDFLNLLSVLLSDEISPEKKKTILQNEYHIAMTEELESGVQSMCNLSEWVWEKGRSEGHASGLAEGHASGVKEERMRSIKRVMENLKVSMEQALDVLDISNEERDAYLNC